MFTLFAYTCMPGGHLIRKSAIFTSVTRYIDLTEDLSGGQMNESELKKIELKFHTNKIYSNV